MKYIKTYENKIIYNINDIIKISKVTLVNHDNVYDIAKIINVETFGDDIAYISYLVTTLSFDSNKFIKFNVPQNRILRLATSKEIEEYEEYNIKSTSNKYNL